MASDYSLTIKPSKGIVSLNLKELWQYKDLLYFLAWRDIKVRYKQAAMGVSWALLQPLVTMVIFTFLFGRLAKMPSDGIPYPIFVFLGLLPWLYFSSSLTQASASLVAEKNLITKIYFPRIFLPVSAAISSMLDFIISFTLLIGLMFYYKITLTLSILFVPFLIILIILNIVGFGLWFSALNVRYRDIQYAVPFFVQIWMFVTPVVYPISAAGDKAWILSLNPMAGVIEGFRAAVLGTKDMPWDALGISLVVSLLVFVTGLIYFKKVERFFADIV